MVSALHLHLAACLDSKYLIHFKLNYLVSEMASIDFFLQSIQGRTWPIGLVILIYLALNSTVGVHNGGQKKCLKFYAGKSLSEALILVSTT